MKLPSLLLATLLMSCSDSDRSIQCLVGATIACTCSSGAQGSQTCLANGTSLTPCICESPADTSQPDIGDTSAGDVEISDSTPLDGDDEQLSLDTATPETTPDAETTPDTLPDETIAETETQAEADSSDTEAFDPSEMTEAIYVRLTWTTPGDALQTDTGTSKAGPNPGADVDLHLLSAKANGAYFGIYDCHFINPNPEWGIFSPSDNPRLDDDDFDGAGPEAILVDVPEQGLRYTIGAHYWNDWGFGPSRVAIEVYIYGILRDRYDNVELVKGDLWESHYIDWPSGTVTRIGSAPRITSDYPLP